MESTEGRPTEQERVAERLVRDERMSELVARLFDDDKLWETAQRDPESVLLDHGVELPEGVRVEFGVGIGRPVPDFEFFVFRLTQCRTYVVATRDDDGNITGYERQEVCRGFEILPVKVPGGPWG